jgi:hypothetical protein
MNPETNKFIVLSVMLFILISQYSCYDHIEGCRDINALNYDVKADNDCLKECCSYPEIEIQMSLVNGTETIDTNKYFPLENGDSIRVRYLRIFFSDFSFTSDDSTKIPVYKDLLTGKRLNNTVEYQVQNFPVLKFKPESVFYNIGVCKNLGSASQLAFTFGIKDEVNYSVLDKLTSSSPLYNGTDSMYIDENKGFYFLKMLLQSKKNHNIVKSIKATYENGIRQIKIYSDFDLTKRQKHIIKLNIDLLKLLKGINMEDAESAARTKIIDNLTGSVSLKPD